MRSKHVDLLIRKIGLDKPGAANNALDALRAMVSWVNGPVDLLGHNPTHGVKRFPKGKGHEPWTDEQLQLGEQVFTGALRRFYYLCRYTGQRISDTVGLNPNDVERWLQPSPEKTGVKPWWPIIRELARELATWERRPETQK